MLSRVLSPLNIASFSKRCIALTPCRSNVILPRPISLRELFVVYSSESRIEFTRHWSNTRRNAISTKPMNRNRPVTQRYRWMNVVSLCKNITRRFSTSIFDWNTMECWKGKSRVCWSAIRSFSPLVGTYARRDEPIWSTDSFCIGRYPRGLAWILAISVWPFWWRIIRCLMWISKAAFPMENTVPVKYESGIEGTTNFSATARWAREWKRENWLLFCMGRNCAASSRWFDFVLKWRNASSNGYWSKREIPLPMKSSYWNESLIMALRTRTERKRLVRQRSEKLSKQILSEMFEYIDLVSSTQEQHPAWGSK